MPDLRWFVRQVEEVGDLARIQAEVDWDLELAHVAKLSEERGGPLLLFERVKGYPGRPVVASLFTTVKRMAIALGAPDRNSICQLARFWVDRTKHPVPPVSVPRDRAPVYENSVTGPEVDVLRFVPVPKLYPMDGGRFIGTAVGVVTQDPETGWVNVGTYRSQVFDSRTLGLQPIKGKDADLHIQNARKRGMRRMPVALVFGSDPLLFLTASTLFGRGLCEYDMVGALRGEPMEVTPGTYTGLPIPADAEYVVEGDLVIAEDELRLEGPFGEYTGYYSGTPSPKVWIDVKALHFRNDPIFPVSTVGRPITDTHMIQSLNRTATLWSDLEAMRIAGIRSVYCLPESGGRFIAVVSVDQKYPGHAEQVGMAVLGTTTGHYGVKYVILVDGDIPADDLTQVWYAIAIRSSPDRCELIKRGRSTPLDPGLPIHAREITSKMIINATVPYEWKDKPVQIQLDPAVEQQVRSRWSELGLSRFVTL
ncbi:MAG: UbiD family decarboxylase [Armatimonadota bacterium]|nr:UbiD family decarboxylase [Armatimonadota bacterium]